MIGQCDFCMSDTEVLPVISPSFVAVAHTCRSCARVLPRVLWQRTSEVYA